MEILSSLPKNLWLIAITGGPCGGKTEGIKALSADLQKDGYRVLVAPEVARQLKEGGIDFDDPLLGRELFQELVLDGNIARDSFFMRAGTRLAEAGQKVVILFDRGAGEGQAYYENGRRWVFQKSVGQRHMELGDLSEGRYHAAMHLVTAAEGAVDRYITDKERHETPAEARALDALTMCTWLCHPHLRVIDNRTDFAGKIERLIREVRAVLGDPVPLEIEDKYLVCLRGEGITVPHAESVIIQDYLGSGDDTEVRIRRRETYGYPLFYRTEKRPAGPRARIEEERVIGPNEYRSQLASRDRRCKQIQKMRHSFVYGGRFFELDFFREPLNGIWILEVERLAHERKEDVALPPFLEVIADVSEDRRFSNSAISMNGCIPRL